jgi:hypothetical protein
MSMLGTLVLVFAMLMVGQVKKYTRSSSPVHLPGIFSYSPFFYLVLSHTFGYLEQKLLGRL